MSLFGAASSGVDPKTGSYLSKNQRIAMFQASQGNGGVGAGGAAGGGGRRAVNPQSAIVVANKMTSVVQKLQTSYQASATAVSEQAQSNKQSLENLANTVAQNRENLLTEEKKETRDDRLEKENSLRGTKENLIEGLSSAAAGLVTAGQRAAEKVTGPIQGLLGKLLKAFGSLALAWTVDNLPAILNSWDNFRNGLPDLKKNALSSLKNMRGVWSIIDLGLRKVAPAIRNVAKTVGRAARFVGRKVFQITKRVFSAISSFVLKIATKMVGMIIDLGKAVKNAVTNGVRNIIPRGKPPVTGGGAAVDAAEEAVKPRSWIGKLKDRIGGGLNKVGKFGKDAITGGMDKLKNLGGTIKDSLSSLMPDAKVKPLDGKQKGFLSGILSSTLEKAKGMKIPKGLVDTLKNGLGKVDGLFKKIPFIGAAIDFMLNKGAGMEFQENISRSLASSIAGMIGAGKGAAIGGSLGATAGTLVMPVAGTAVGGAIGAALGAILGGMLGGTVGDTIGAAAYGTITGEETTDTGLVGGKAFDSILGGMLGEDGTKESKVTTVTGSDADQTIQVTTASPAVVAGGLSTPEGLNMPGGSGAGASKDTTAVIDLEPLDQRTPDPEPEPGPPEVSEIDQDPFIPSFNPETSFYREMSASYYDLVAS